MWSYLSSLQVGYWLSNTLDLGWGIIQLQSTCMYEDMINLRSGTCGQCHQIANVKTVAAKFGVCCENVNFFTEEFIIHLIQV